MPRLEISTPCLDYFCDREEAMEAAMWQWCLNPEEVAKSSIRRSKRPHCIPPSYELLRTVGCVSHSDTAAKAALFAKLQVHARVEMMHH